MRATTLLGILAIGCGARGALEVAPAPEDGGIECVPAAPAVESCNGLDDDCDSAVDEDLGFDRLGDPLAIRIDEGETGPCDVCRWAWGTALLPTSEGWLATWRVSFDGLRPMPNAFARPLDRAGLPTGPARTLFEAPAPQGFRIVPSTRERALLAFCIRDVADDIPASAFLDARGALLSGPTQRTPRLRGCGGQLVDAVWTGRRHLFTWLHGTDGIALDVADEDGRSLRSEVHDRDGWVWIDPGVRLSAAHGGVLQVFLHRPDPDDPPRNELVVRRLDLEGNVRSELVVPIDDGQAADPLVASAARGWLIVARRNADGGYYTVRVDDDGTLLSGATLHDVVREQHNTHSDLEPRPGGGFYFATTVSVPGPPTTYRSIFALLDEEGRIERELVSEPISGSGDEGWVLSPDIVARDGEAWVLYHGIAADADFNRVLLQRYGCVAP